MATLLARWRIGYRGAILGLVGIVGMLLIAGICGWPANRIDHIDTAMNSIRDSIDLEGAMRTSLLRARRYQKDFLLGPDEQGTISPASAITMAESAGDALRLQMQGHPDELAKLALIRADVEAYAASFADMANDAQIIGYNEIGALRTSVHDVEETLKSIDVPSAEIAMQMMRRHEKDFITRVDPKYGAELKARLPEFVAAIDSAGLPEDLRGRLMSQISTYQNTFERFMAATLPRQRAAQGLNSFQERLDQFFGRTK